MYFPCPSMSEGRAPTPQAAAKLSSAAIAAALRKAGRKRNLEARAAAIQAAVRAERLDFPASVADAYGAQVRAAVAIIGELKRQIATLEDQLDACFNAHPDADENDIVIWPHLVPFR